MIDTPTQKPASDDADDDYNVCPANTNGKHGPLRANVDWEIANTHVSVECVACGTTTGYPIEDFAEKLEWN